MIRILFVEDDAVVMSNLKRVLQVMRRNWDMKFAASGEEALTMIDDKPYDVVVADNMMPGILGSELLALLQYQQPQTVRVLLLDATEAETAVSAAGIAHRILRKPCDPDELFQAVQRTCELQQRLNDPDLQAMIGQIGALPSPSRLVFDLNDMLNRADATAADVAALVETDISLTAKLLQVVNSAYFSLSHHIAEVSEAVAYLGMDAVRDLSVAMEIMRTFDEGPALVQSAMDEIHEHSLTVAHVARELCTDRRRANEAFVAAMLHDVGLLVVASQMPEKFIEMRVQTMRSNLPLTEVEMEVVGAHHADIGAHLLDLWGLPHSIVEAASRHHDAPEIPSSRMDALHAVHIADAIVSGQLEPGDAAWEHDGELDHEYLCRLGVEEKVMRMTVEV